MYFDIYIFFLHKFRKAVRLICIINTIICYFYYTEMHDIYFSLHVLVIFINLSNDVSLEEKEPFCVTAYDEILL